MLAAADFLRAPDQQRAARPDRAASPWSVLICLLGAFQLLGRDGLIPVRGGGKTEALLAALALRPLGVPRETLLGTLWADNDSSLAGQSLNSLVHAVHRLLATSTAGAQPVINEGGVYRLNPSVGIATDVACFDAWADRGDLQTRRGEPASAAAAYEQAAELYRGDLCSGSEIHAVVERERLRGRYLTVLVRLADWSFARGDFSATLHSASRLLLHDPCREDAHRLVMRCHVRLGERSQALRQYRVCVAVMRAGFDAEPEPATHALYEQLRSTPDSV